MKKHRKAMLRITGVVTSLMIALAVFITLSSNASNLMHHRIVLGHSEIQQALQSIPLEYDEYEYLEPMPLRLGYSQNGLLVEHSDSQWVYRTYLLTREVHEIADQIRIPHDSAILKSQVLEALEEKVLIRFYNDGEEPNCDTCQIIVAMDTQNLELTIIVINTDGSQHVAEVSVDGYHMEQPTGENLQIQQWEANVEDNLTDEEVARYAAADDTYVELIYPGQADAGYRTPPEITASEPESTPKQSSDSGSEPGYQLEPDLGSGADLEPEPNPGSEPGLEPEPVPEPGPDFGPEPDPEPEPVPEPGPDFGPEPDLESDPGYQPEYGAGTESIPQPESALDPQPLSLSHMASLGVKAGGLSILPLAVERPVLEADGGDRPILGPIPKLDEEVPSRVKGSSLELGEEARLSVEAAPKGDGNSTQTLHTAIILYKHVEELGQTGDIAELAAPGSGIILSSIPIFPSALLSMQKLDGFYLIKTPQDLDAVRTDLNANYRLANDIDLTGYVSSTCTEANGWLGIGRTYSQSFRGEFDGDGFAVKGLWMEHTASANHGLFGVANGAKIYDLTVETASAKRLYTSYWNLGVIAGYAVDGTEIRNCHAVIHGDGLSARYQVGGIVGKANDGVTIDSCTTTGGPLKVTGGGYVGGIVGLTNTGREGAPAADEFSPMDTAVPVVVKNCSVNGEGKLYQTSGNYTGGVIGVGFRTEIYSCIAENVWIDTNSYGGGFAGNLYGRSRIEDSHVKRAVVVTRSRYPGGFAGEIHYADPSYTDAGNSEHYNIVSGCGVTDAEIKCAWEYGGGFAGVIYERSRVQDCRVTEIDMYAQRITGGFGGVIYGNSEIEGCSVGNAAVESRAGDGTGGFAGKLYDNAQMTDCYALNGTVRSGEINTGGLLGQMYNSTRLSNSFAEMDVIYTGNHSDRLDVKTGGLIGILYGEAEVSNCYATGNVSMLNNVTIRGAGGLVGSREGNVAKLENCYSTGTIAVPAGSTMVGGLCGNAGTSANIKGCYFDTTTTRQQNGIGNTDNNPVGVTPLTTTQMIDGISIGFAYGSTIGENGTSANPWYIDPGVTYPYLYYQYNGHGDADRNYTLGAVNYSDGASLAQSRADFAIQGTVPFAVRSAGAKWAYFPYIGAYFGPGTGPSMYVVNGAVPTDVPAVNFTYDTKPYSLGGISATGIVAFSGVPGVDKHSDRPAWQSGQPDTYTYLGDVVHYELKAGNYSVEYDWYDPVLRDPLPNGVRLVEGSAVTLQYGNDPQIISLPLGTPGDTRPYYTYDHASGVLEVYLNTLHSLASSNTLNSATIRFSALIYREAVTEFKPDGSWEGDNIRNSGTAFGELRESDGTVAYQHDTEFDDRNTDPVYDKWIVIYNSNYTMDDVRSPDDLEQIKGYYLTDYTEDHTVLHNDNPENGLDYLNFALTDYNFDGWFYYDSDGTSTIDVVPGDVIESVDRDMVLFARWKSASFTSSQFAVKKELVKDDGTPLTQVEKDGLPDSPYKEAFQIRMTLPGPGAETYLATVEKEGIFTWSVALPEHLPFGEYIITEDTPTNYRLQGLSLTVDGIAQTVTTDPLQPGQYRFTLDADMVRDKPVWIVVYNTPLGFRSGDLNIKKTIDGEGWDNANAPAAPPFTVSLTGPGSGGPSYTAQVDNNTGIFDFSGSIPAVPFILLPGDYILTELDKDGYALNSIALTVTEGGVRQPSDDITETGKFQIAIDTEGIELVVDNAALHPLALRKVAAEKQDGDYIGLGSAVFELFLCHDPSHTSPGDHGNAGALIFTGCWQKVDGDITSLADGLMDLGLLKPGHYALLEKTAPDGYDTARGYWVFTLNSSGTLENIAGQGQPPAFVAMAQPDGDNITYLVPNFEKTSLPLSGAGTYGFFAVGILCILSGILLLCHSRKGEF